MDHAETLKGRLEHLLAICGSRPEPGGDTSNDHLAWMCRTALDAIGTYPADKLARWSGYVAGCLACKGVDAGRPPMDLAPRGPATWGKLHEAHRVLFERYRGVCEANPGVGPGDLDLAASCNGALSALPSCDLVAASELMGFVQGCLTMAGLLDVKAERDLSRPLFNAAYAEGGAVPPTLERPAQ
jgi:hypothetical protein